MVYSSAWAYAWDFCLLPRRVEPAAPYHLLYLSETRQGPTSPVERRHAQWPSLSLASSSDLTTWSSRQSVLGFLSPGGWDRGGFWPGCAVEHRGTYVLAYTGAASGGWHCGIGLMTATDPTRWTRPDAPVTEYLLGPGQDRPARVRDPWIVYQPTEGAYYLFYVVSDYPPDRLRWIGCARSRDLETWEPLGPIQTDGLDGWIEGIQVAELAGRFYLLYTRCVEVSAGWRDRKRTRAWVRREVRYLVADRLLGPYSAVADAPLLPPIYSAARIVDGPDGQPVMLAVRDRDDDDGDGTDRPGRALGVISDPALVQVLADGRLSVEADRLWPVGWRLTNELTRPPAAFVERGLVLGLLSLDRALALARSARESVSAERAPIPRVDYLAAILQGGVLDAALRFDLEQQALRLALTGVWGIGDAREPHFESLVTLIPALTDNRREIAVARAQETARKVWHLRGERLRVLLPLLRSPGSDGVSADEPTQTSERASDLTARAQRLGGALVDGLRRPGQDDPDAADAAVDADTDVDADDDVAVVWQDDEDRDIEYHQFVAALASVPHLQGAERAAAVDLALEQASRVAHTGEFSGRDLSLRRSALGELALWLTTPAQRRLARAMAVASGITPPASLDWPPERLRQEQARAPVRRLLGTRPEDRWTEPDAWTIEQALDNVPEAKRAELIADVLDTLWHQRLGLVEGPFQSVALRVVARRLSKEQIAEHLRRFGLTAGDAVGEA